MKLHLNELKTKCLNFTAKKCCNLCRLQNESSSLEKEGQKIVALNRSIRKNLIKVKEFTRQHNCGREGRKVHKFSTFWVEILSAGELLISLHLPVFLCYQFFIFCKNIAWIYYKYFVKSHCMIIRMLNTSDMISFHYKVFRMASIFPLDSSNIHILNSYASMECIFLTIHFSNFKFRAKMTCYEY